MPVLPLPPLENGVPIDSGELVVSSTTDVSNEWSFDLMASQSAPIRDAIIAAQTAMAMAYQQASRYAAAQNDPLRATDEYLQEIGAERGVSKNQGESDDAYRARINAAPGVVDPADIIAAANAVLAPFTNVSCVYAERSDGWFVGDGSTSWSSHVFAGQGAFSQPNYPDRLYGTITARVPPGAMLNGDQYGRWFLLRAPDISLVDSTVASVFAGDQNVPVAGGFFLSSSVASDGVTVQNATYLFDYTSTVDAIYASLVGAVEQLRMHGVRWSFLADPALNA